MPWQYYVYCLFQFLSCKHLICLEIFVDCLVHDFLWKSPVVVRVCFQPVTGKLLVKGWLAMTWLISICRPESGAVRCKHRSWIYHWKRLGKLPEEWYSLRNYSSGRSERVWQAAWAYLHTFYQGWDWRPRWEYFFWAERYPSWEILSGTWSGVRREDSWLHHRII